VTAILILKQVIAYELGYRIQPQAKLRFDVAGFYNVYDRLRSTEAGAPAFVPAPSPHIDVPVHFGNELAGETYGVELASNWKVTDVWNLGASYTWLHMRLRSGSSSGLVDPEAAEGDSPRHQFQVRSYLNLPRNFEFDTALYYVDSLSNQNAASYVRLDVRLGWRPTKNLDLSIGLQNLIESRHKEFGDALGVHATQVERSVYGKVTWRF